MEDNLIKYTVICHTEDCYLFNKEIEVFGPEVTEFLCGPCGIMIDDWKISKN
jgi:hypothetical protein